LAVERAPRVTLIHCAGETAMEDTISLAAAGCALLYAIGMILYVRFGG
jgi:hypothetical protein